MSELRRAAICFSEGIPPSQRSSPFLVLTLCHIFGSPSSSGLELRTSITLATFSLCHLFLSRAVLNTGIPLESTSFSQPISLSCFSFSGGMPSRPFAFKSLAFSKRSTDLPVSKLSRLFTASKATIYWASRCSVSGELTSFSPVSGSIKIELVASISPFGLPPPSNVTPLPANTCLIFPRVDRLSFASLFFKEEPLNLSFSKVFFASRSRPKCAFSPKLAKFSERISEVIFLRLCPISPFK